MEWPKVQGKEPKLARFILIEISNKISFPNCFFFFLEVILLSTFWQKLLESKLYFQYLFNHPGIMHYCIIALYLCVTVVYFEKVCVYISIITFWMFSYQFFLGCLKIHVYMIKCTHVSFINSVTGLFLEVSAPSFLILAEFSPSILPTQLSGLLLMRIILVFWTRTITLPPWQGSVVRGVLTRSTSHHIHTREFISEVFIPCWGPCHQVTSGPWTLNYPRIYVTNTTT